MQGVKWFTKFNILGVFNRIRVKVEDEWKIAFRTRLEYYEYLVILFGLINTLVIFQVYINNILRKYLDYFVIVYLDDILVYSKTREEYI